MADIYDYSKETLIPLYRELKKLPNISRREERALFRLIAGGSSKARERVLARNVRLVVKVALLYRASPLPLPDLISEGTVGLIKALEEFDISRGNRFSSYAVWQIRAHIVKAVYEKGYMIRLSGNKFRDIVRLHKSDPDKGHTPGEMKRLAASIREEQLLDLSAERLERTTEASLEAERALSMLPKRQADILRSIFGLDGLGYLNITQLAEIKGVCTNTIRRERDRALKRLNTFYKEG